MVQVTSYKIYKLDLLEINSFYQLLQKAFKLLKLKSHYFPEHDYGNTLQAKLVGVNEMNKMVSCVKCTKNITDNNNSKFVTCSNCNTFQTMQDDNHYQCIIELIALDQQQSLSHILRSNNYVLSTLLNNNVDFIDNMQQQLLQSPLLLVNYIDNYITSVTLLKIV